MEKSQLKWFLTTFQLFDPQAKEQRAGVLFNLHAHQSFLSRAGSWQAEIRREKNTTYNKISSIQHLPCLPEQKSKTPSDGIPC